MFRDFHESRPTNTLSPEGPPTASAAEIEQFLADRRRNRLARSTAAAPDTSGSLHVEQSGDRTFTPPPGPPPGWSDVERSLGKAQRGVRIASGRGAEEGAHETWLTKRQASRYQF